MAGLTVATFLTMVVVPVVYCTAEELIASGGSNKYILGASKNIKDIANSKFAKSATESIKKTAGSVNKTGNVLLKKLGELVASVGNSIKNKKR